MRRIVVIALKHPDHQDLFLHGLRRDNGKWALPGGHAKDGENLDEAARRELKEETGLQVSKLEQVRNGQYPSEDDGLEVTLFYGSPTDFRPNGDDDPDAEFLTFKYARPEDLVNCHVPKERNILIEHLADGEMVKSEAADRESEKIRRNRKYKKEAREPHPFTPAEWTHPNGHPRCILCGDEERTGGKCPGADHDGLEKGVMRRIAPFNPAIDVPEHDHSTVDDWQRYGNSDSDYRPEDINPRDIREGLNHMHQHSKVRAMNKLMGLTPWRSNPDTKEREFLLHRGMSPEEYNTNVNADEGVVHHANQRSSWTTEYNKAKDFTDPSYLEDANIPNESTGTDDEHKVVSAWIPESKIVHMPKMYGRVGHHLGQGDNDYGHENEVIVEHGHKSKLHKEKPEDPRNQLHAAIGYRQPGHVLGVKAARDAHARSVERALESVPKEQHAAIKSKLGMKLAASEKEHDALLAKAPEFTESNTPTANRMSEDMVSQMLRPDHGGYKPVHTAQLPNGLFHHVLHRPGGGFFGVRHTISTSKNPHDKPLSLLHTVQSKNGSQPAKNVDPDTWQVSHISVMPEAKGQGAGKQVYMAAALHHGGLASGTDMSPQAHNAWKEMAKNPSLHVALGQENDPASAHHMRIKPGTSLSALFPRSTSLAASEDTIGEPLEKMPKVFSPTKKKPYTTVVRIQNKEGHGPYTAGDIPELEEHGSHPDVEERTPRPVNDPGFTRQDHQALGEPLREEPLKFGFENEEQMHGWFHPHEIEAMAAEGFKPTKVKAAHVWSSGKQAFFERYASPFRAKKAPKPKP